MPKLRLNMPKLRLNMPKLRLNKLRTVFLVANPSRPLTAVIEQHSRAGAHESFCALRRTATQGHRLPVALSRHSGPGISRSVSACPGNLPGPAL